MNSKTNSDEQIWTELQREDLQRDKLLGKLAELLVLSESLKSLGKDLWDHNLSNHLREEQSQEEAHQALRLLLENYPFLLQWEDVEQALQLPEDEQGEKVFDSLMANMSNEDA